MYRIIHASQNLYRKYLKNYRIGTEKQNKISEIRYSKLKKYYIMARSRIPRSRSPRGRRFQQEPQPEPDEFADAETVTGGERADDELEWDEESADAAYHERYVDDDFTPLYNDDNDWIQGPRTPPRQEPETPPDHQEFLDSLTPEQRQMYDTFGGIGMTPPSNPPAREEGVPEARTP